MKDALDDMINASCSNHSPLIEMGVPAEQALRIAFGAEFTDAAIETSNKINTEQKQNDEDCTDYLNLFW
ncbi:MAG: hypothetical protein JJE25_03475 [Bacteroidia bacterium]|nr:hypothetical protein [Bacteroidia bacterium]